eukprot:750318-Hanusia_phi.AAC.4
MGVDSTRGGGIGMLAVVGWGTAVVVGGGRVGDGGMALVIDGKCGEAVEDVRKDATASNWAAFKYEGKNKIVLGGKGSGG